MIQTEKAVTRVFGALMTDGVRRATMYLSPTLTVKATWQRRRDRRARSETLIVTVGRPNYREREFVRACEKAGEPFPVKKIQIQHWPKKAKRR